MPDPLLELTERGELEPFKASLLTEWLKTGESEGPSAEALARLLVDPEIVARLRASAEGPWDSLVAQARSILAHERVGVALRTVASKVNDPQ